MITHVRKNGRKVNSIEGTVIKTLELYKLIQGIEERLANGVDRPAKAV